MSREQRSSARDQCAGQTRHLMPKPCPSRPIYRAQGGTEVAWTCGLHLSSTVREIGENHRTITVEPLT